MTDSKNQITHNNQFPINAIRNTLLDAEKAASLVTLPLFRSTLAIDNKYETGFDPVTKADRDAEKTIRDIIEAQFPEHAIIGEEFDNKHTNSPFTWIIDPIDGTRAFISGLPVWGTLIGLTYEGRAIAGLMSQPFTGEIYLSLEDKAELLHKGNSTPLRVRDTTTLDAATMFTTTPELFSISGHRKAYDAVEQQVRLARYGCDCYAYSLLAAGQIDLVIEPLMNTYDIAALVPIVESAGGVVSTWDGDRAENGGNIIAAATTELRDAALEVMHSNLASG